MMSFSLPSRLLHITLSSYKISCPTKKTYTDIQGQNYSGVKLVLFVSAHFSSLHIGSVLSRPDNIRPHGISLILS